MLNIDDSFVVLPLPAGTSGWIACFAVGDTDALYLPLLLGESSKKNDWLQSGDLRSYCRWITKFFRRWIIRCTSCICFGRIYLHLYAQKYMHAKLCFKFVHWDLSTTRCFYAGHHIGEISIRKWRLRCLHALQVPTCVVFFCLKNQGTIGCTPNSAPMVFIVFSRDSWGL